MSAEALADRPLVAAAQRDARRRRREARLNALRARRNQLDVEIARLEVTIPDLSKETRRQVVFEQWLGGPEHTRILAAFERLTLEPAAVTRARRVALLEEAS